MNNDIRNLSKWLNEEQTAPIDRQALARVLAMAEQPKPLQGWKLVPADPTADMWKAVNKLDDEMAAGSYDGKGCSIEQAWDCLLAAAPQPAQQQEPVAWMHEWEDGERIPTLHPRDARESDKPKSVRPLVYGDTSPPAQRKPLMEEEMFEAIRPLYSSDKAARLAVSHSKDEYRAIEAAHGIKENT